MENIVKNKIAEIKDIPTMDDLHNDLQTKRLKVTFKKADGSTRVMACTCNPSLMPKKDPDATGDDAGSATKSYFIVWDLEANGYRSFYYDKIEKVEYL